MLVCSAYKRNMTLTCGFICIFYFFTLYYSFKIATLESIINLNFFYWLTQLDSKKPMVMGYTAGCRTNRSEVHRKLKGQPPWGYNPYHLICSGVPSNPTNDHIWGERAMSKREKGFLVRKISHFLYCPSRDTA